MGQRLDVGFRLGRSASGRLFNCIDKIAQLRDALLPGSCPLVGHGPNSALSNHLEPASHLDASRIRHVGRQWYRGVRRPGPCLCQYHAMVRRLAARYRRRVDRRWNCGLVLV